MAGQRRGAVERLHQPERARSRCDQRDVEIAAAGEAVDAEQVAGAGLQVDVLELELRLDVGDRVGARDPDRALGDAAIDLRLADRARQRASLRRTRCGRALTNPQSLSPPTGACRGRWLIAR